MIVNQPTQLFISVRKASSALFGSSLRRLRVLCVSAVNAFEAIIHRRVAEVAEITQSKTEIRAPLKSAKRTTKRRAVARL